MLQLPILGGLLDDAMTEFRQRGWEREALDEMLEVAENPELAGSLSEAGAEMLIQELVRQSLEPRVAGILRDLSRNHPTVGAEAVLTYASQLLRRSDYAAIRELIQQYAELLRSTPGTWSRSGGYLDAAGQNALAVAWLSDWKEQQNLEFWMLRSVFMAYLSGRYDEKAEAVGEHALTLPARETDLAEYLVWLALMKAVRGDTDAADDLLDQVEPVGMRDNLRVVHTFAQVLITAQRGDPADRLATFQEIRDELDTAAGSCEPRTLYPETERWYQKTVQRLVQDLGGWRVRWWSWMQGWKRPFRAR
jgi:tetratricopeptide (TPR) repeat protein